MNLFVANTSEPIFVGQPDTNVRDSAMQFVAEAVIAITTIPAGVGISNIEIINLNSGAGSLMGQVDASQFGAAAQEIWQVSTTNDVTNLAVGQTAGFRGGAVDATVSYDDGVAAASVALQGVTSGATITVAGADVETVSVSGSVAAPAIGGEGTLELVLPEGADDEGVSTLNLALTSDTVLDGGSSFESIVTVDASASTGGIEAELTGTDAFESILGGSGDDDLTLSGDFSADVLSISGGAGDDAVTVAATDTDTAISVALGAGADRIKFTSLENVASDASDDDDLAASLITITDFNANDDVLDLSGLRREYDELANDQAAAVSNAGSLTKAVAEAAKYIDAGDFTVFDYGGDAYVYAEDGKGNDGLIMLEDVSIADLDSTAFIVGVAEDGSSQNQLV